MKTIILTGDARGDRTVGIWLRDLGFKLIEAGCEITISRMDGAAAQEMLANRGMEVVQVVDAYSNAAAIARNSKAGTRAYVDDPPHRREDNLS